jgi:hypothetical protein
MSRRREGAMLMRLKVVLLEMIWLIAIARSHDVNEIVMGVLKDLWSSCRRECCPDQKITCVRSM